MTPSDWLAGCFLYVACVLALFALWIGSSEEGPEDD